MNINNPSKGVRFCSALFSASLKDLHAPLFKGYFVCSANAHAALLLLRSAISDTAPGASPLHEKAKMVNLAVKTRDN